MCDDEDDEESRDERSLSRKKRLLNKKHEIFIIFILAIQINKLYTKISLFKIKKKEKKLTNFILIFIETVKFCFRIHFLEIVIKQFEII